MRKCKPKPCSECKAEFQPMNSLTKVCSYKCAAKRVNRINERKHAIALKKAESVAKSERRARKTALKKKSDYEKDAQRECNAYIRERDKDKPCISCGTMNPNIQYCAGHFKSVGSSSELRYHPMNINKQCNFHCNSQKSGNIEKYRPELVKKIGLSNVEWLEGPHETQNRTVDDLIEVKLYYREQHKILKIK